MKRDFQEEYQNYIESDMPDLWSRIEPNLKEKAGMPEGEEKPEKEKQQESAGRQEKNGQEKIIYFMKRAVPAAACLCALFIGIGVMGISKNNSAEAPMEAACAEPPEAGMAYDAEPEVMEEAAAEEEAVMWDESYDETAAMDDGAASAEAPVQGAEENADMDESPAAGLQTDNTAYQDPKEGTNVNKIEASEEAVTVERAVLSGIAVASEEMQEEGYAYAYTFRLEDNSRLIVYLTNEQCKDLEEREVEIKRQAAYTLSVFPMESGENSGDTTVGESFLENLEKLP